MTSIDIMAVVSDCVGSLRSWIVLRRTMAKLEGGVKSWQYSRRTNSNLLLSLQRALKKFSGLPLVNVCAADPTC